MRPLGLAALLLAACAEEGTGLDQTTPFEQPPMAGSLSFRTQVAGAAACDLEVDLLGTAIDYVGSCDGCDLRFALTSTLTADNSSGACTPDPLLSMLGDDEHGGLVLWYQDVLASSSYYYGATNPDVLWLGYHLYREGEDPEQAHYRALAALEDPTVPGSVSWSGSVLSWLWYQNLDEPVYLGAWDPGCGEATPFTEEVTPQADQWVSRTWVGDHLMGDAWTIETRITEGPLSVGVEVTETGAFTPVLRVIDPNGCLVAEARENVECTYANSTAGVRCAAWQTTDDDDGVWTVVVLMDGAPVSSTPAYQLWTNAGSTPELVEGAFTAWDQPHDNTVQASMITSFAAP